MSGKLFSVYLQARMATAKSRKGKKRKRNNTSQNEPTDVVDEVVDDCKERFTFFFRSASPFSQWHPAEFEVNGVLFNCAEQFMMYQKASKGTRNYYCTRWKSYRVDHH